MISFRMREAIRGRRKLCWLFWFESDSGDLYAWSGDRSITWDGQDYVGLGSVSSIATIKKPDSLQHATQEFTLNGLDPSILGGLSTSVRTKPAKVWLAALDEYESIIPDPVLISELVQDTLSFNRSNDDVLALTLTAFEALPFLGKAQGGKYSHEAQLLSYGTDVGFEDVSDVASAGPAVEWREG